MRDITRKLVELLDLSPIGDDHFQPVQCISLT